MAISDILLLFLQFGNGLITLILIHLFIIYRFKKITYLLFDLILVTISFTLQINLFINYGFQKNMGNLFEFSLNGFILSIALGCLSYASIKNNNYYIITIKIVSAITVPILIFYGFPRIGKY